MFPSLASQKKNGHLKTLFITCILARNPSKVKLYKSWISVNYPVLALGVQMYWSHLIFILFLSIRATTLPFPHVPSLHTAWAPSTIWRIQWEINVLLRVQTHNVWWDIDKLFAHTGEKEKKSQLHQFNPRAWDIFPFSFSYVLVQITFSDEPNGRFSKCCWPLQLLWCLSNHTHLNGALLKPFQNKCGEKSRISLVSITIWPFQETCPNFSNNQIQN